MRLSSWNGLPRDTEHLLTVSIEDWFLPLVRLYEHLTAASCTQERLYILYILYIYIYIYYYIYTFLLLRSKTE